MGSVWKVFWWPGGLEVEATEVVEGSWWLLVGGWVGWVGFDLDLSDWVGFGFDCLIDRLVAWFGSVWFRFWLIDYDWLNAGFDSHVYFWFWKEIIIIMAWFMVYLYVFLLDGCWLHGMTSTPLDSWIKIVDTVLLPHRNDQQTPGIILLHLSESTQKESFCHGKTQQFGHLHIMTIYIYLHLLILLQQIPSKHTIVL